ncbi:hypothetical protein Tco_0717752 [Tanacetum coccineum]
MYFGIICGLPTTFIYTDSEQAKSSGEPDEMISMVESSPTSHRVRYTDGLPIQPVAHHHQLHTRPRGATDTTRNHEDRWMNEDGDDDDGDSSGDDADDEDEDEDENDEDKEDEEEEGEHLAPADSAVVVPTVKLVSPPEGTWPVIHTNPLLTILTTGARCKCPGFRLPYPFHQRQSKRLQAMPQLHHHNHLLTITTTCRERLC